MSSVSIKAGGSTGNLIPIAGSPAGSLQLVNEVVSIAEGRVAGYSFINKFGRNPDIDSGNEDVWNGGSVYTGFPAAAGVVRVTSDSTKDTSTGVGARTVTLLGYSSTGGDVSETVTVDSTSTIPFWRLPRAFVATAGSSGVNQGAITVFQSSSTGVKFAVMPALFGQTQIACGTIPYGYLARLRRLYLSMSRANGAAGSATVGLMTREVGGAWRTRRTYELATGGEVNVDLAGDTTLGALGDYRVHIFSVSDINTQVTADVDWVLEPV